MKRLLTSLLVVTVVLIPVTQATMAVYSDKETGTGNTFTAGTLDLEVDGENDPLGAKFSASNMVPGETYHAGTVTLANVGSVDGLLSLMIENPVSNDNGVTEMEEADGDIPGTHIDSSGYDAETGNGELWDQTTLTICLETGAGSHSSNDVCDWDDTILYSNDGTPGNDYSSTYSVPLSTDLAADNAVTLSPSDTVNLVVEVTFVDDESGWWWGGMSGVTNNMAMTDDMVFDVVFGLEQVTP